MQGELCSKNRFVAFERRNSLATQSPTARRYSTGSDERPVLASTDRCHKGSLVTSSCVGIYARYLCRGTTDSNRGVGRCALLDERGEKDFSHKEQKLTEMEPKVNSVSPPHRTIEGAYSTSAQNGGPVLNF